MVAADPDRFTKVAVGNTGLPYNPDVDQEVIESESIQSKQEKSIQYLKCGKRFQR